MAIQRVNVLGVGISVLNLKTALAAMAEAVSQHRKGYICITGVHGVMEAQDDPEFRRILNGAFLCTPDGMSMVWSGKLRGHGEMSRVYGPDLMLEVCAWSQRSGCRHFFYGGMPGVPETLRDRLVQLGNTPLQLLRQLHADKWLVNNDTNSRTVFSPNLKYKLQKTGRRPYPFGIHLPRRTSEIH